MAARWAGGQYHRAVTPRRHNSSAGSGVLDEQGQGFSEDSPKQCAHDDQELAETAKRSIHGPQGRNQPLSTFADAA
jgi:hypothetical protein